MNPSVPSTQKRIVILGNPNTGKSTLFNRLTGLRQQIGNYPGVTVEKKTGTMRLESGESVWVEDLPGAYSLLPRSPDEEVVHDVLLGLSKDVPRPDLAVVVLDAANLERNLYLASQVLETGLRTLFVFNMWDLAAAKGIQIDLKKFEELLGVTCIQSIGRSGAGTEMLKKHIQNELHRTRPAAMGRLFYTLPSAASEEIAALVRVMDPEGRHSQEVLAAEALRLIGDPHFRSHFLKSHAENEQIKARLIQARTRLESQGVDWASLESNVRYQSIESLIRKAVRKTAGVRQVWQERIDSFLMHPFYGFIAFAAVMGIVFQAIFSWAQVPMGWIESAVSWLGNYAGVLIPEGALQSLVVDGIIAGIGNVIIFLPQIFLLFFFIALFEDSGYMARAAFVLDHLMSRVGLNGKTFLPLVSSFACAIPGVLATRIIEDRNERLATILVIPLISCSARLPVYALMIGAFIPDRSVLGFLNLKGITLLSMYFISVFACLGMAFIFRKTFLKGSRTPFVLELCPYRIPHLKTTLLATWDRGKEFIYRAGTIIFCLSILLWFLTSYPKNAERTRIFEAQKQSAVLEFSGEALKQKIAGIEAEENRINLEKSFAGMLGRFIEPVIQPLGFDWKIGIGLVGSFAAREILVSTLAIVYNVSSDDAGALSLMEAMRREISPVTGKPVYNALTGISLMVFFVLACQCMSTIAIVRRETQSWRWPVFMVAYMTALAWAGSFAVFQTGRILGWG